MLSRLMTTSLVLCILGTSLFQGRALGDYDYNPSTKESPDPRAVAIKPTLLKLNDLVIAEIQKGVTALAGNDINNALRSFISATQIEPYDPMAYILLIKTLLSLGQEDMAYTWVERSGRNLSDSNQIIAGLYQSLPVLPPAVEEPVSQAPVSIAQFKDNKQCAVSFIFDDGEPSVATDILPMFEKYGFRTTVAINPGVTAEGNGNIYRGNWDAWREAKAHGHEIANHGTNHIALPELKPQELEAEVVTSFEMIRERLGEAPSTFIFPEDKATPEIVNYVEKMHLAARDHESLRQVYGHILIPVYGGKRFSIPTGRLLIDIAVARRLWLIPQCHGLYSTLIKKTFKSISPELLNDQLVYLKQNNDKIWVGRFIDVYKYLRERKGTTIKVAESSESKTVFSLATALDTKIYSDPLTIVIDPPSKIVKAHALDKTNNKKIPARITENKIYLDVAPSNQTIEVKWQ